MKHLRNTFSPVIIAIVTAGALLLPLAKAQGQAVGTPQSELPPGESVQGGLHGPNGGEGFNTQNSFYSIEEGIAVKIWSPPRGAKISAVYVKTKKNFPFNLYIVGTTDGYVYEVEIISSGGGGIQYFNVIDVKNPGSYNEIIGDDLYAIMGNGSIYVTHNDTTWQVDTAGLNGAKAYGAALDSSQTVYLATSKGILKQALGAANPWQMLTSGFFQYIYASRDSRIFANGFKGLMMSTDLGATWASDTAGLGMSFTTSVQLTDDSLGTVYAITLDQFNGDHLWQQKRGGSWQPIGTGSILSADPTARFIINDLLVDSGFYLATQYGEFYSGDNGATWTPIAQVPASDIYSYLELSNGRKITTTSLGLFTKDPSDTAWTKRFPANSYLSGIPVTEDNAGHLYAFGSSRHKNGSPAFYPQIAPKDLYVSTDHGTTWHPDTVGNTAVSSGIQFIDELGNQHIATSDNPPKLFFRAPGGVWQGDSSGYVSKSGDAPSAFASDHKGWIYLAIGNSTNGDRLFKRQASGGAWSEVTTNASIGVPHVFTATKDGKLVGGNDSTEIGYYDGSAWNVIPNPPGLSTLSGLPESVDSSNRLWVIFGNVGTNKNWTPNGVYWTSDLGKNWTKAAGDTLNFASMVSFGDTTYGLGSGNGLYYFVPANSTGVIESKAVDNPFEIVPNPSTGKVELSFTLGERNMVRVTIFDILGREIVSPLQAMFDAGKHTSSFDLSTLGAGTYYCRIQSSGIVETEKFVIKR